MELYDIGIGARVKHPSLGIGVIYQIDAHSIHIFFREHGEKPIARSFEDLVVIAPGVEIAPAELDLESVKDALREVLDEDNSLKKPIQLARRWQKGVLEMRSADPSLKSKEVPIEDFFHKIVMMRDRFRVLEQKVNAHPGLTEQDKVEMQQYITRCYGSLTTFNILFDDKEDNFVGQKGEG
ncbi:MAG: hypothetical protein WAT61_13110 [Flavobacteriales bacterium]|jgi:hypothetical protein|nr:hypothetical protein [Flavobacteriales bacterium]MBP9159879.1 hypothetical protein [Flavobacteriales bacterium]